MKNCLRVPRLFLPEDRFAEWCAVPGKETGANKCIYPGTPMEMGDMLFLRDDMYVALTDGTIGRLFRGMALVRRTCASGGRMGLLAAADLEEYAPQGSKTAMIRATSEADPELLKQLVLVRGICPLEIPHVVLAYRDKRNRIMQALPESELEELYDFSPLEGERLQAWYLPPEVSAEVAEDLCACADPCFGVLDGGNTLTAAKQWWDKLKKDLSPREAQTHPARYVLAEFVNITDPAVVMETAEGGSVKKEDLLAHWKSGKLYPAHSLRLASPRLPMEAREISYD